MSTPTSTEVAVVEEFLAALEDFDIERAIGMLAPDVRYQNVSLPAAHGVETVGKQLRWMAKLGDGFQVRMHNIAANGPVVLTERTDVLIRGRFAAEFWVCGVFEVRDGKIAGWRDYFDWANFLAACVRGVARAVIGRTRPKEGSGRTHFWATVVLGSSIVHPSGGRSRRDRSN